MKAVAVTKDNEVRDVTDVASIETDEVFRWVHLDLGTDEDREWLREKSGMSSMHSASLLADNPRPRSIVHGDELALIVRAMNFNGGEQQEEMLPLGFHLRDGRIITCAKVNVASIAETRAGIINHGEVPQGVGDLFLRLVERVYEPMEPFLDNLESMIADWENRVACNSGAAFPSGLPELRRRAAVFRRFVRPQASAMQRVQSASFSWMGDSCRTRLDEVYHAVLQLDDEVEELSMRSQILNEEIRNLHADRLNDITYLFTVVATIFLPLGFLTGLLGINVGGMPGTKSTIAFWLVTLLCVVIAVAQFVYFRARRLF